MKRMFSCSKCGLEFEVEADYFIPGISGTAIVNGGVRREYVDPTTDKFCLACIYEQLVESSMKLMAEAKDA